jgi:hypothetical protein
MREEERKRERREALINPLNGDLAHNHTRVITFYDINSTFNSGPTKLSQEVLLPSFIPRERERDLVLFRDKVGK